MYELCLNLIKYLSVLHGLYKMEAQLKYKEKKENKNKNKELVSVFKQ